MYCGIDGSYMEEGVSEIYILDTDELFSSYTKLDEKGEIENKKERHCIK